MQIGYARVSTDDQDTAAQVSALKAAGCERIYKERTPANGDAVDPLQNRSFAQHPPVRERQVSRQTSATLKGHCLRAFGARFKTYPL